MMRILLPCAALLGVLAYPVSVRLSPNNWNAELPASAANVWRIATKAGHSASACPVADLDNGTWLFLTSRHVTQGWVGGATGAIVESRDKQRKLIIVSATDHPTKDISILRVKGDDKDIELLTIDFAGNDPGDTVYTVGYPGPLKLWFGYRGYLGLHDSSSSHIERGMSGGALLDDNGQLSGILMSHAFFWQYLDTYDKEGNYLGTSRLDQHFPEQSFFVPLKGLEDWLRKHNVIE